MPAELMARYAKLALLGLCVAGIGLAIELAIAPKLLEGIPLPFGQTGKPIGGSLFNLTFFHALLATAMILLFAYLAKRIGFDFGIIPRTRGEAYGLVAFVAFISSGFLMWYHPIFLIGLLASGIYLLASEIL
ncbi:MAG: hypothetical protein QXQ76_02090 [Candidatus Bathyarchaeia archaeon]